MRGTIPACLASFALAAKAGLACETVVPDPTIGIPSLVESFIDTECRTVHGPKDVEACRAGERAGYRATVAMLLDEHTGARAAAGYRACRGTPAPHGGRFHREKAACVGNALGLTWQFDGARCNHEET